MPESSDSEAATTTRRKGGVVMEARTLGAVGCASKVGCTGTPPRTIRARASAPMRSAHPRQLRLARHVAEARPLPARQHAPEHALGRRAVAVVQVPVADPVAHRRVLQR